MSGDFASLYASLGISPDCDMERLKHMFRKRISELHPDRGGDLSEEELLHLYFKALRFHRRHGRFPGGRASHRMSDRAPLVQHVPPESTTVLSGDGSVRGTVLAGKVTVGTTSHRSTAMIPGLTLLALLVLGLAIWNAEEAPNDEDLPTLALPEQCASSQPC